MAMYVIGAFPNTLSLAIATLGLTRIILSRDELAASHTIAAAAVIFVAAFVLFWRGVIGGGDAKLVAAVTLLIGDHELPGFLFLMSLCGGALAVAMLARDQWRLRHLRRNCRIGIPLEAEVAGAIAVPTQPTVPYGVAIAVAGAITLMLETSLAR